MQDKPKMSSSQGGTYLMTADEHRRMAARLRTDYASDPEQQQNAAMHESLATAIEKESGPQ